MGTHSSLQVPASPATSISSPLGNYKGLPTEGSELPEASAGKAGDRGAYGTSDSATHFPHGDLVGDRRTRLPLRSVSSFNIQQGFLTLFAVLCKHRRCKMGCEDVMTFPNRDMSEVHRPCRELFSTAQAHIEPC